MNLLITGSSGFVGRNILPLLAERNTIYTLGRTKKEDYSLNLACNIPDFKEQYDAVLHIAGKAHTESAKYEQIFFDVNVQGTKNLCTGLEKSSLPKAFIYISSVAVYGCDIGWNITENHPLNGSTPYALSKIQAEQYLTEWCIKHNVILGIIRPSLIAGPNPPGNLGAMIKGIKNRRYISIQSGRTPKSMLMVQDIADLVMLLAEKGGVYNVCDSYHPTFRELETIISKQLNISLPFSIPYWVAKSMALIGDCLGEKAPLNSRKLKKITSPLTFSNEKAVNELQWNPSSVLDNFKYSITCIVAH